MCKRQGVRPVGLRPLVRHRARPPLHPEPLGEPWEAGAGVPTPRHWLGCSRAPAPARRRSLIKTSQPEPSLPNPREDRRDVFYQLPHQLSLTLVGRMKPPPEDTRSGGLGESRRPPTGMQGRWKPGHPHPDPSFLRHAQEVQRLRMETRLLKIYVSK